MLAKDGTCILWMGTHIGTSKVIQLLSFILHFSVLLLTGYAIYSLFRVIRHTTRKRQQSGHDVPTEKPANVVGDSFKQHLPAKHMAARRAESASIAKERLQIIVSHNRVQDGRVSHLPNMQREILEVIRKYVEVDMDAVSVRYEEEDSRESFTCSIGVAQESGLTE
jgi:cell division topological specificity factor